MTRRDFLWAMTAAALTPPADVLAAPDLPRAEGRGDVRTPTFYRHDVGVSPGGRLHEPSADAHGNLWTSPCDGTLWRYHVPTGRLTILNLKEITGFDWKGLHLWPVAYEREVYLCCPTLPTLWVYHWDTRKAESYDLPPENPQVYGGFAPPGWSSVYFYAAPLVGQRSVPGVTKWDPKARRFTCFPCAYRLSGELYMTFADAKRREIWGSTYTSNDLVRFDTRIDHWTGHWKSPLEGAASTPSNLFVGDTLFVSDHLRGRLVPFDTKRETWGDPIPVPGFREWFGYLSGGMAFRNLIYFCHSTWTGGNNSLDGKPHHFLGTWTVFDPRARRFSRLDIPAREGESFMSDYALEVNGVFCLLAVDSSAPYTAVVCRSSQPR